MTSLALDVGTSELTGLRLHARHPLTRQFLLDCVSVIDDSFIPRFHPTW